jgi:hypothetical protein
MQGNTVAIYSVLKKKTKKLNSQLAQYEEKKIDKDNSEKNKKIIKKEKNNHVRKHCSNLQCFNLQCFKEKTTNLNSEPVPY